jgi:hypothetical protein
MLILALAAPPEAATTSTRALACRRDPHRTYKLQATTWCYGVGPFLFAVVPIEYGTQVRHALGIRIPLVIQLALPLSRSAPFFSWSFDLSFLFQHQSTLVCA